MQPTQGTVEPKNAAAASTSGANIRRRGLLKKRSIPVCIVRLYVLVSAKCKPCVCMCWSPGTQNKDDQVWFAVCVCVCVCVVFLLWVVLGLRLSFLRI